MQIFSAIIWVHFLISFLAVSGLNVEKNEGENELF